MGFLVMGYQAANSSMWLCRVGHNDEPQQWEITIDCLQTAEVWTCFAGDVNEAAVTPNCQRASYTITYSQAQPHKHGVQHWQLSTPAKKDSYLDLLYTCSSIHCASVVLVRVIVPSFFRHIVGLPHLGRLQSHT